MVYLDYVCRIKLLIPTLESIIDCYNQNPDIVKRYMELAIIMYEINQEIEIKLPQNHGTDLFIKTCVAALKWALYQSLVQKEVKDYDGFASKKILEYRLKKEPGISSIYESYLSTIEIDMNSRALNLFLSEFYKQKFRPNYVINMLVETINKKEKYLKQSLLFIMEKTDQDKEGLENLFDVEDWSSKTIVPKIINYEGVKKMLLYIGLLVSCSKIPENNSGSN